jgi:hypothetical protein
MSRCYNDADWTKTSLHYLNENGKRLTNMRSTNELVIGSTLDIPKIIWISSNNHDKE